MHNDEQDINWLYYYGFRYSYFVLIARYYKVLSNYSSTPVSLSVEYANRTSIEA